MINLRILLLLGFLTFMIIAGVFGIIHLFTSPDLVTCNVTSSSPNKVEVVYNSFIYNIKSVQQTRDTVGELFECQINSDGTVTLVNRRGNLIITAVCLGLADLFLVVYIGLVIRSNCETKI